MSKFQNSKSDVLNPNLDMNDNDDAGGLRFGVFTNAERDAAGLLQGTVIYNSDVNKLQLLNSFPAAWENIDTTPV